jgi:hypothetical protein
VKINTPGPGFDDLNAIAGTGANRVRLDLNQDGAAQLPPAKGGATQLSIRARDAASGRKARATVVISRRQRQRIDRRNIDLQSVRKLAHP